MAGTYISDAQWQSTLQALGPQRARQWAAENGIEVDDDMAYEQQYGDGLDEDGELPAVEDLGVPVQQPSLSVAAGKPDLEGLFTKRRQSLADMYDQAAKELENRYKGPGTGELLLSLGAAFLKPTEGGTFGESISNLPGAILPYMKERREYRNAAEAQMAKLRLAKASDLADLEAKYFTAASKPASGSGMVWSENLKRFLPKGEAVVIEGGTLNGKRTERMSDGTVRVYDSPTLYNVYDAGGNRIGQGGQ